MNGVRIKVCEVRKRKVINLVLPDVYMEETGVKIGDTVDVLKTTDGRLIIQAKNWKPAIQADSVSHAGGAPA